MYWAIVTVTTVGYGDITPHTPLGRIVASVLILIGYSVIATYRLITTHMSSAFQNVTGSENVRSASKASMNIARNIVTDAAASYRLNRFAGVAQSDAIRPEPLIRAREYGTACGPFPGTAERGRK